MPHSSASLAAIALLGPSLGFLGLGLLSLFVERRLIGIAQKRLGVSFLGRHGWAHWPADLIKLWSKQSSRHQGGWTTAALGVLGATLGYLAWSLVGCLFFLSDAGTALADFWDFQIFAYLAYANLSTLLMYAVVAGSKSKYATLAGARLLIGTVSLEVFFALAFLAVYLHVGGFAFEDLAGAARRAEPLLGALPPLGCFFLLYVLFEAKRAPFDHSEAESELVAGHMVEFGGRSFLFFLAAEYLHLILGVFLLLLLVVGEGFPLWVLVSWPFWADLIGGVALAL